MSRPIDEPITSLENPQVRLARSLLEPAGRRRHRAFLVEGHRLVEAAAATAIPRLVLHTPHFGRSDAQERTLLRRLRGAGVPVRPVEDRVLADVTDTVTPQGIVAVMPLPAEETPLSTAWSGAGGEVLLLILDAVGDPGNAGTLLRSAAGTGVSAVIATRGTVDLFSPKVVRAGAGAHFQVAVQADQRWSDLNGQLASLCGRGQVLLADADAATPYWEADWTKPSAVVVGNEAHGASDAARDVATGAICIPTRRVESLNVAVAGSIILFEALRQRTVTTDH